MTSAVPSSARNLARTGSLFTTRKMTQVRAAAATTADRMPSFASASTSPCRASDAISRDTVKPIPATVPVPATAPQPTDGRTRPWLTLLTSHAHPTVPSGLPTRYPTMMPSVTGAV